MASLSFPPVVGLTGRVDPRLFSRACCRTRASPTRCLCLYPIVPECLQNQSQSARSVSLHSDGMWHSPFLSISYTTQTIRRESDYWILPIARFPRLHTSVAALACLFLTQLRSFPTYPCRSISPQVCIPTFSACVPERPQNQRQSALSVWFTIRWPVASPFPFSSQTRPITQVPPMLLSCVSVILA